MIKLNRPVELLENALEKIEAKIEQLSEKRNAIEENAADYDRDLTAREWDKIFKYDEQIEALQFEMDEIENALDYIRDYAI
jgi:prefoldin subunit 5